MLLATAAGPAYYRMCSTDVYQYSKQTGSNAKKTSPIISSFLELGQKLSMQPKFGAAQMLLKQKPNQTFVNGLLGFITLGIYTPLEAPVLLLTIVHELPIDMGNSIYCSLIYFWVPPVVCIVISLSEGEIIPFSGVCQSRLRYPRRRRSGGFTHWLTNCFNVQPTTTSSNIITQSIIFSFSVSAPSCILHRAQQHHADASACQ